MLQFHSFNVCHLYIKYTKNLEKNGEKSQESYQTCDEHFENHENISQIFANSYHWNLRRNVCLLDEK